MGVMKRLGGMSGGSRRTFAEVAWFFDSPRVIRATDDATRRVFSRFGAYTRSDARRSIRNRKRASRPGQPPTNRTGKLKGNIFFWYTREERIVTIGPALFNARDIPGTIEEGGEATLPWGRIIRVAPRPYMRPAFNRNLQKLPPMWRNSVKASV